MAPFCLDATEVTVRAWAACARSGACPPAPDAGHLLQWTSSSEPCDEPGGCRVRRGGGWSSRTASRVNAGIRFADPPTQRQPDLGFRCAAPIVR